jgi:hypothetical protein
VISGAFLGSVFAVAMLVTVARAVILLRRPIAAMTVGDYAGARSSAATLRRSWLSLLPGVRRAAEYSIAACFHLEGAFDASLEVLTKLHADELDASLRYACLSLEAANLVLDRRDLPRADAALREARAIDETPEDLLLHALALAELDRADEAEALFADASRRRVQSPPGLWRMRPRLERRASLTSTIFHSLRGAYLARTGRYNEAKGDLEAAAESTYRNVYAERARAVLAKPANADDLDPRSSLAPQVLDDGPTKRDASSTPPSSDD